MTQLVGILNLTPDSFSGDGHSYNPRNALEQLEKIFQDGAAIVDVGAESTRPGATPLNHEEEWRRLSHFLEYLKQDNRHDYFPRISIDTYHPETAKKALAFGVGWINDVWGFQDARMVEAVKDSICDIVVMHSLSIPADPQVTFPPDTDIILALINWANERLQKLEGQGIARDRVILDPGIGFGKTAEQSQAIIDRIDALKTLGVRLLVGHSRKSFLKLHTSEPPGQRDAATAEISVKLAKAGVDFLRVHNVVVNRKALDAHPA